MNLILFAHLTKGSAQHFKDSRIKEPCKPVLSDLAAAMAIWTEMRLPHGTLRRPAWPVIRQGPRLHMLSFFHYLMTNTFIFLHSLFIDVFNISYPSAI